MPVHVEQFESEVTFTDSDSPLSEEQFESLFARVLERLMQVQQDEKSIQEATSLRSGATPPAAAGG